ncbi:Ribosomal protein L36 [Trinorchestia longiramus]|nr:Ribosomal protein L36 [Trinorchestia longiramus]
MLCRCRANIPMKTTTTFCQVRNLHSSIIISRDVPSPLLTSSTSPLSSLPSSLLQGGAGVQVEQQRGMKVKDILHRRCRDCYFVYKSGVLHVKCRTHPRHNARNKARCCYGSGRNYKQSVQVCKEQQSSDT